MTKDEVEIGGFFTCGGNRWKVTDKGTRTVIAIPDREGWMSGPPYQQQETVFDEDDFPACEVA